MSRKLVERVSRVVDRRAGRRGFLRRSAMAATAVAVAPVAYAIRPTTAEAAIIVCRGHQCRAGDLCCDNWSEFCCKITGENLCPPGTIVAGWWKADGSGFCDLNGPRPRYYLDCNYTCDEGCWCSSGGLCARSCTPAVCQCHGGCSTRKSECLTFRYGQCHQDVCVGQLKCRIVTCVPPWKWDPACATAPVLTSQSTRFHDRPCLHEGFTDIPPLARYAEAVEWMAGEGIATGFTDDLFGPDEPVSRGQFATFLWRYSGEPSAQGGDESDDDVPVPEPPWEGGRAGLEFDDVDPDAYYADAVAWMVQNGITAGRGPRQFDPWSDVNRAQSIVFLHNLAGKPEAEAPISFTDVGEDAWFRDALEWALAADIVWWTDMETFGGSLPASRADVALLLHRYHLREPDAPEPDAPEPDAPEPDAPEPGTPDPGTPDPNRSAVMR
ncbi:MAG: S-layer homology domain-containing protein [Acidimicrobiaceae bacterium]|nr:S-layer homology domain-containing protein [Acidimicrobiaceae bacterium]